MYIIGTYGIKRFSYGYSSIIYIDSSITRNSEIIFVQNLRKPSGVYRRIFTDEQEWYFFEHVDIEITEQIDEYLDDEHNHSMVICSCHVAPWVDE